MLYHIILYVGLYHIIAERLPAHLEHLARPEPAHHGVEDTGILRGIKFLLLLLKLLLLLLVVVIAGASAPWRRGHGHPARNKIVITINY